MAGELMKRIGVGPGRPITEDGFKALQEAWLEVYLCFQILMTHNPEKRVLLGEIKEKLAEVNELISKLELWGVEEPCQKL